ncbi:hypothetical protein Dimus_018148 [Dionaea muscipula]
MEVTGRDSSTLVRSSAMEGDQSRPRKRRATSEVCSLKDEVKALPAEFILSKRVIRCKIFGESWMIENGLSDVMNLIKRQRWEGLFRRRELMHIDACKEFYANLTLYHYKKKEVTRSRVRGVEIEFDSMRLASILSISGNNGICEYIKEVWEESKYTKPLEITRKFANDELINVARRVRSSEMNPFQRFVHFAVMNNLVPRFGNRDTTSFMDLTYIDHLLKRENGVWWLGTGDHRRRDDDVEEVNNDAPAGNEEEQNQEFDWEAVIDEVALQGEHMEKEVEADESGSREKFFYAEDEVQESAKVSEDVLDVPAPAPVQQKQMVLAGVDPSALIESILESVMIKLQADFERAHANRI